MSDDMVFVSRVIRLSLNDSEGSAIGRVADVVLVPLHKAPPRVLGFVAVVQRRKIFVNVGRIAEIGAHGVRLRGGSLDLRRFEKRSGEKLAAGEIMNTRHGTQVITDLALRPVEARPPTWELAAVSLGSPGPLRRRRSAHLRDWTHIADLLEGTAVTREIATMRDMRAADVARIVRSLPLARRQQLAEAMEDERLAEVLEELPEDEQLRIIERIDIDRLAHIIEEMDPDDAVDLLGEMTGERRGELLATMDPEEARPLRRLLLYDTNTAGGLMTSEPVILTSDTTVAEALALLREYELPPVLAAQVFVTNEPISTPTGPYLGVVGIQRLLREMPSATVGQLVDPDDDYISPNLSDLQVAQRLARYDLLAIAVVDEGGHLLGAVTVDDMLDHILPVNWRRGR